MQNKIKEIQVKLATIERTKRYLEAVERKLVVEKDKMDRLAILVEKEYQDVERLTKESFARSVKNAFLKEDKSTLEKEKKEYLEAALLYKEELKIEQMLLFEKEVLEGKIKGEKALLIQLDYLNKKQEKKAVIKKNPAVDSVILLKKVEGKDKLIAELKEVISVGEQCQFKLNKIINLLEKIEGQTPFSGFRINQELLLLVELVLNTLNALRPIFLKYDSGLRHLDKFSEIREKSASDNRKRYRLIYNIIQWINEFTEKFLHRIISDVMNKKNLFKTLEFVREINHGINLIQNDLLQEKEKVVSDLKLLK